MRYLPDVSVLLLEVTGSRRLEVNEEGGKAEDWFTDYKLKEAIAERVSDHGKMSVSSEQFLLPSTLLDRSQTKFGLKRR